MADNTAALRTMDAMIAELRATKSAVPRAAEGLVPIIRAEIDKAIAAGHGLDGVPWPKTKEGKQPLRNASKAVSVRAVGNVVLVTVSGPEAVHQFGTKKDPQRAILPTKDLPRDFSEAVRKGLVQLGPKWAGGK